MIEQNDRSQAWEWVELKNLFSLSNGDELPKDKRKDGKFPVYGGNGKSGHHDKWNTENPALVIGRVGAKCGNVHLCEAKSWVTDNAIYTTSIKLDVFLPFYKYLLSFYPLNSLSGGSGQPYISQKNLKSIELPLPPKSQQKQIVAKVEELFSKLDSSVSELQESKQRLEKYRRSVLKKAVNGGLTQEWRSNIINQQKAIESYEFPAIEEEHEVEGSLASLPEGWAWAKLGDITDNFDSEREPVNRSKRAEMQGEYPYYGASGVIDHLDDYILDGRYLLVSEDGANLENRTKPIAFIVNGKFWPNNHAHVVQTKSGIPLDYLELYIESRSVHQYLSGTAQPKLTQTNMNKIPVPIGPQEELEKIVGLVQRDISVVESTTTEIEDTLSRSQRLRQSILKSAFEGKLVPKSPHSYSTGEKPASKDAKPELGEQQKLSEVTSDVE